MWYSSADARGRNVFQLTGQTSGCCPQLIITTFYLTEFEECAWVVCLISQRNTAGFHLTKQIDKLFRCALPVVYPVSPLLFRYFSCKSQLTYFWCKFNSFWLMYDTLEHLYDMVKGHFKLIFPWCINNVQTREADFNSFCFFFKFQTTLI